MATHEQNIENLRSAVYGEQVRGSMIELFEEDYKLVKNGLGVGTDITSPSSSTEGYSDGNVYLNIETQDIWKLENEAWAKKGNMKGIQSIEYTPTTGDGQYNILTITLTDGSEPIVCRIKNGETGNGVESVEVISTVGNVKTYRMTFTDGTHYDWDVQEGGHVIANEEGTVMAQQPTVQFIGANVENDTTTDPSNPVTKVTIPQGGHRIASTLPNGSIMPVGVKREVLEFNGFNVEDNPDPNHLSTVVHGQLKVCATKAEWDALSQAEKDDPNTYWVRPWADTVAFATDKTPVGAVLSVATAKDGEVTDPVIHTPSGTFPTDDYLVCNGQSVPLNKYPALAKYFEDNFGSVYYFTNPPYVAGYFSLPNWSSDFPSNGVLVMKARESSNAMSITEIDDTSVSEDKTWSSDKIDTAKADNSVIAPVENGSTASQAYAIGKNFIHDNKFCTAKTAIAQGETLTLNTNYTAEDIASVIRTLENKIKTKILRKSITVSPAPNQYSAPFTHLAIIPWDSEIYLDSYVSAATRLGAAMTFSLTGDGLMCYCSNSNTQNVYVYYLGN